MFRHHHGHSRLVAGGYCPDWVWWLDAGAGACQGVGKGREGGAGILFLFILLMLSDVLHREDAVGILLLSIGSDRRRRRRCRQ